jgi:Asp-tRNA(Asn)/Glu-tRNA(Gln) amidotransferase A subunit family amidase
MKTIISQPMKGKTEQQVRNERAVLVSKIEDSGHTVIDTVFPNFTNEGNVPLKYLAKSLEAIADVDAVVFMSGWKEARGCRIEHQVCEDYGIKILEPDFFAA